jgi:putative ABC transport system permease protein
MSSALLGHYFLTLYRSLTRHRLYAALNVLGLATGIGVFLVLTAFVRFQTSFEDWIPNARNIYEVRTTFTLPGIPKAGVWGSMGGMLAQLQTDYPQIIGTRLKYSRATVRNGDLTETELVEIVDRNFFTVFDLPFVTGNRTTALADPPGLILTQSLARKYFGDASPLGRTLTLVVQGTPHVQRVTGVIKDPPANTDFPLGIFIPAFDHPSDYHWSLIALKTFLVFRNPAQAAALNREFDGFVDRHAADDDGFPGRPDTLIKERAVPLLAVHLSEPGSSAVVFTLAVVALLTLLVAAVNYANLATVRAALRAREVAMRKVLGATRRALVLQFMGEAIAVVAIAALIGLALTELALPAINAVGGTSLALNYFGRDSVLPILALTVLLVGFGAGAYPTLIISRFQPAAVLASSRSPAGGRRDARVREALVIFQFAVAIAFTVCTAVLLAQTRYIEHASLGFQRTGLVETSSLDDQTLTPSQRAAILAAFRALPGVTEATESDGAPGDDYIKEKQVSTPGRPPTTVRMVHAGVDFFTTYRTRRLAGRWLDLKHGLDDATRLSGTSNVANVVLNARAVSALGFASPSAALGQIIRLTEPPHPDGQLTVVGVTDDVRFHSPRSPLEPTVYFLRSQVSNGAHSVTAIRYQSVDPQVVVAEMRTVWRQMAPSVPLTTHTAEQRLSDYYRPEAQRSRLFTLGAVIAVLLGCVGLFGLASFTTARRTKEIGIRKTLGASTADVLRLLIGQFLRPVLVANLIAWPIAYVAMRQWLSGFDQRIALGPSYFLAATALTVIIALATVAGQAFAVARAEPAKALRDE